MELKKLTRKAAHSADILEIWVDSMPAKISSEEILGIADKPLIIVNKSKKEKGDFRGTEEECISRLVEFVRAGADFVDVSAETPPRLLKMLFTGERRRKSSGKRTEIIFSHHDFKKTPPLEGLKKLRDKAFRAGAHLFKLATFARSYNDNLTILQFLADSRRAGKPVIAHCMGEKGRVSRLLAPIFGSYIIFVALDSHNATAPGQLTLDEYEKISSLLKL